MRRLPAVALALLLLAAFLLAIGPAAVAAELAGADPIPLAVGAVGSLAALVSWSEAQRRLHRAAGARVPAGQFLRGYLVGVFGKQVLPGGQVGGPAVVAYAVGRETALAYESDLAAVTVGKLLGTIGAAVPVLAGLALVSVPAAAARPALAALAVAVLGIAGVVVVARARPAALAALLRGAGRTTHRTLGRVSTRVRRLTTPAAVEAVVDRGRGTFAAVGRDSRALAVAFGLTVAGWACAAIPLWGAAHAVGVATPLAVALFAVPIASIGTLVPLPSGAGGVDLVLGGLLVAVLAVAPPTAAAVVLLYRVLVDVLPAIAGAVAGSAYLRTP